MAAAVSRLSPTASLLRNSRLFALPASLPPPAPQASSELENRSDTATLPYPIRASIETPLSCLNRGDWGLKRPLPLKSTAKTGTPCIRIQDGIDTIEHITNFESAADHTLTLRKWQELSLPISTPDVESTGVDGRAKSAFEPSFDNIKKVSEPAAPNTGVWPNIPPQLLPNALPESEPEAISTVPGRIQSKRWKFDGPWLAGMSGMEFESFLQEHVRQRKGEFRHKVESRIVEERKAARKKLSMEEGKGVGDDSATVPVTEEEVQNYMKTLRSRPDAFGALITEFFDLPEGPNPPRGEAPTWQYGRSTSASKVYTNSGPPKSHPSAGLSYLKVGPKTWARNDPVFGPQELNTPIPGRVLKTRRNFNNILGALGVAGVVANRVEISGPRSSQFQTFRPKPGGHKRIVRPMTASIFKDGTINLNVKTAANHILTDEELVVREEGVPIFPKAATAAYRDPSIPLLDDSYRDRRVSRRSVPATAATSEILQQGLAELAKTFDPHAKRAS